MWALKADCAVDLAEDLHRHDLLVLALQPVGDVGHLLPMVLRVAG